MQYQKCLFPIGWKRTERTTKFKTFQTSNSKYNHYVARIFFTVFRLEFNTIVNTCIYHVYQYFIHCKSKRRICNSRDWNSMVRYWTKCNKDQQNRFLGYWTPPPPSSYSSAVPSKTNACESFHTTWRQENSPRLTCKNALGHNSWNLRCKTATFVSGTVHRISRKMKQQNGYHLISYHDVSNIHQAINTWHKINYKYSTTTQPINSNKNGAACTVELKLPPTPARRRRHPRDLGPRHKKCL